MTEREKRGERRKIKRDLLPIQKQYQNIVLCGGGSKCIALCGCLHFLEKHKLINNIQRVVGTSAGALIGLLLTLGYTSDEIDYEIEHLSGKKIFGNLQSLSFTALPQLIYRLISSYGIDNGDALRDYLKDIFIRKGISPNTTFAKLYKICKKNGRNIKFTAVATSLTHKNLKIFNVNKTPNVNVIDAVMASTCIPFIFKPIKINGESFLDGGLKNNFPVSLIPNKGEKGHTIALRLETYDDDDEYKKNSIGFITFISDILDVLFSNSWADENLIKRHHNVDIYRIKIPNVNFIDFDLPPHIKQSLRNSGYDTLDRNFII